MKVARPTTKIAEPIDIWIGFHEHVRYVMQTYAVNPEEPGTHIIATCVDHLAGLGTCRIHFCGNWHHLPCSRELLDYVNTLRRDGRVLSTTTH